MSIVHTMRKYAFALLPVVVLLGCLQDPIDGPQVVPRPIFPPGAVYYTAITNSTSVLIRWNPPTVDTQQNFKGYFVKLYKSAPFFIVASNGIDSVFEPGIDSAHVLKSDTSHQFLNELQQGARYTVKVWGERFPDPKKPDSLVLSLTYQAVSFTFDASPVFAPDSVFASSAGPSAINLFWRRSNSEQNIGFAGYIIRYIDPTQAHGAILTFAGKQLRDTNASQLTDSMFYKFPVTVTGNATQPTEKEYKFWIKAVRQDSVESADSVGIVWSGAERIPPGPLAVRLDTGIFIGIAGFQYNIVQTVTDGTSNPQFAIHSANNTVTIQALPSSSGTTTFVNRVDRGANMSFETNFFGAAFQDADFSQTQLSFPAQGTDNGAMIYAKFPDNNRARILFSKVADTTNGNNSSYIRDSTILIQASFQPIEHPQLPFF